MGRPWNEGAPPDEPGLHPMDGAGAEIARWKAWMESRSGSLGEFLGDEFRAWWDSAGEFAVVALWVLCCELADRDDPRAAGAAGEVMP